MKHYYDTVFKANSAGVTNPAPGASIQVNVQNTLTPAALFSDDGITPKANPVTADSLGRFDFFVANGRYDLVFSGSGLSTFTQSNVEVTDAMDTTALGKTPIAFTAANTHSGSETFSGNVTLSSLTNNRCLQVGPGGLLQTAAFNCFQGNISGDGLTHGTSVWWTDPGWNMVRNDFDAGALPAFQSQADGTGWGNDAWVMFGTPDSAAQRLPYGDYPPHMGVVNIGSSSSSNGWAGMCLNSTSADFNTRAMALLDYPGWQMSYVFWFPGPGAATIGAATNFVKKTFYIGLSGFAMSAIEPSTGATGLGRGNRPDCFLGLRYDTSHTPEGWGTSNCGNASGGVTQYNMGTSSSGGLANTAVTDQYKNCTIKTSGYTNAANNGTFTCTTSSTGGQVTLNNASGVAETPPGDTSIIRPLNLNITAVTASTPSSGFTQYQVTNWLTVTGTGMTAGGWIGQTVTVTGCTNSANNVTNATVVGSYVSGGNSFFYIQVAGVTETPTANAAFVTPTNQINDFGGNFKMEYVNNGQYQPTLVRHNVAGTVVDTGIAPQFRNWYRLDMSCAVAGQVKMTLTDENNAVQFSNTFTIPKISQNPGSQSPYGDANNMSALVFSISNAGNTFTTVGATAAPQCTVGSLVTLSGYTGAATGLNATFRMNHMLNPSTNVVNYIFQGPSAFAQIFNQNSVTAQYYPSFTPIVIWGCDDTGAFSTWPAVSLFGLDFWSFAWNPNLGPNAPGTPNTLLSRYF